MLLPQQVHTSPNLKPLELENNFQVDVEGISDEQILHSAVGILRRDIEKLKISVEDKQAWPSYHHAKRHSIRMY